MFGPVKVTLGASTYRLQLARVTICKTDFLCTLIGAVLLFTVYTPTIIYFCNSLVPYCLLVMLKVCTIFHKWTPEGETRVQGFPLTTINMTPDTFKGKEGKIKVKPLSNNSILRLIIASKRYS